MMMSITVPVPWASCWSRTGRVEIDGLDPVNDAISSLYFFLATGWPMLASFA